MLGTLFLRNRIGSTFFPGVVTDLIGFTIIFVCPCKFWIVDCVELSS